MIPLSLTQLQRATGATLVPATNDPGSEPQLSALRITADVVTDSRAVTEGSLYVARRGEHADGHDFVAAAAAAGAVAALAEHPVADLPALVTDDVQTAFGAVAREVLRHADPDLNVIGITGSSGKTSTKDLLSAVLATDAETVAPVDSLNGEIGVPLTICRITTDTRHLVVEMGARGIGHIAYLTDIAPPRIAIVLNVGVAHLGEFGGVDAIAQAKGELVEALPAAAPDGRGGVAILNADDPVVAAMAQRTKARVVLVGTSARADVRAEDIVLDPTGRPCFIVHTPVGSADVALPLHGAHHVGNALAVIAAALECGLSLPAITAALAVPHTRSRWRMEVTQRADGVTIVNDAYNANPDSMHAALNALASMSVPAGGRRIAVLGGMLELGPDATELHREVGEYAARQGIDEVIAVGTLAEPIAEGAGMHQGIDAGVTGGGKSNTSVTKATSIGTADDAYEMLSAVLRAGDVVLFKSSRDSGLRFLGDRLVDAAPATPQSESPADAKDAGVTQ